jgi:hypothetical protein
MSHCAALSGHLDHDRIDDILDLRETLWHRSRNINFGGSWRTAKYNKITAQTREQLHNACDYFIAQGTGVKLNVLQDQIYIYTNQYSMRDDLVNLGFVIDQITTVKLNRPIDTVKSNDKDSILRCYFKQVELTEQEYDNLVKFLENNKGECRPSRAVEFFIERGDNLLRNYFFIDFKNESLISALELMTPNLIRKILPRVK